MSGIGLWTPGEVKALRLASRATQREFAALAGIGWVTLLRWEKGHQRPTAAGRSILDTMYDRAPADVRTRMHDILALWSEGITTDAPVKTP